MQDAGFLRARAEQGFRLANAIKDTGAASNLRTLAADYHARAIDAESQTEGSQSTAAALPAEGT